MGLFDNRYSVTSDRGGAAMFQGVQPQQRQTSPKLQLHDKEYYSVDPRPRYWDSNEKNIATAVSSGFPGAHLSMCCFDAVITDKTPSLHPPKINNFYRLNQKIQKKRENNMNSPPRPPLSLQ